MPTEYAPHYSDFQLYVEGKSFYKQLFTDIREAKAPFTRISSFCRMIKVAILFKLIKREGKEGVNVYLSVDRINDLSFERKMKMNCRKMVCILHIVENLNYHSAFILFIIVIIAVLRRLMGD